MATSYDTVCTTLSQEGRIYQLEYAEKAIEKLRNNGGKN